MLQKFLSWIFPSNTVKISRFDDGVTAVTGAIKKPSKARQLEVLSQLVSILGVFQAIATLPQAVKLYSSQDSTGLSFASWLYYSVFAVVLVVYGIAHKQKPLVISYTANALAYSSIAAGIILFR